MKKNLFLLTVFLIISALYLIKVTNFKFNKKIVTPKIQKNQATVNAPTAQEKLAETPLDELLWQKINYWRTQQNLKPYFADESLCQFAKQRLAGIDSSQLSHANFWPEAKEFFPESNFMSLAENLSSFKLMQAQQPNLKIITDEILESWLQSEKHAKNLTANFTHSCLICENQACVQIFASYY